MTSLPPGRTLRDLRQLTPARVGLGRTGASLPTDALLQFTRDHARARDAVHAGFDVAALVTGLNGLGLRSLAVSSRVRSRRDYLARPDLGRMLDPESRHLLASHTAGSQLAIVVGPGLSAPDSLGAYLTFAPQAGRTDAERNCISNIHGAGLGYDEAALRIAWLIRQALVRKLTGVTLKDESGGAP